MPWKTNDEKEQRWKFIQEHRRRGEGLSALCRRWRISRKTAYKWLGRFDGRGRWGLGDQRRVAVRIHHRPGEMWLQRLRRWRRRHPHWGAAKLRWALAQRFGRRGLPSEAAIGRWLKAWGLTRKRRRSAHRGPRVERPRLTAARRPNDVWTVDFKGWFKTGQGVRVDPLTVRDLASRYLLAIVLFERPTLSECRQAFARIFREHGLPQVIRSDNGTPFGATGALGLTRLSAWWVKLGIRVEFIAPGHPEQNGAHEQMHRVYQEEVATPPANTFKGQNQRGERWRQEYNHHRPHEGLEMRVPAAVYRKSRRPLPRKLGAWRYPPGWESRLVKGKGMISLDGRGRFIGEAFEGERVGLKRCRPGVWAVYFGPLQVGELWDRDGTTGIRAIWHWRRRRR